AIEKIFTNSTNTFSDVGPSNTAVSPTHRKSSYVDTSQYPDDPNMPELEDITYYDDEEYVGTQTRSMTRVAKDQEPKRVHQAHRDPSLIEAMQEELRQFKMQKVWVLVDFPNGKRAIGHTQEEGIDYEDVFALVERIEAIRFEDPDYPDKVYKVVKALYGLHQAPRACAFLYGTIKEEVYVCQPLGFKDPDYPDKLYKVVKALYGLHQALRAWYETLANYLLENGFQRVKID
nr:hypothetical protein [Tanacetum cinerariifolium]